VRQGLILERVGLRDLVHKNIFLQDSCWAGLEISAVIWLNLVLSRRGNKQRGQVSTFQHCPVPLAGVVWALRESPYIRKQRGWDLWCGCSGGMWGLSERGENELDTGVSACAHSHLSVHREAEDNLHTTKG
jgi:hypothetical protein